MCGWQVDFVKCLIGLIPVSRLECKFHSRIEDVRLCNQGFCVILQIVRKLKPSVTQSSVNQQMTLQHQEQYALQYSLNIRSLWM